MMLRGSRVARAPSTVSARVQPSVPRAALHSAAPAPRLAIPSRVVRSEPSKVFKNPLKATMTPPVRTYTVGPASTSSPVELFQAAARGDVERLKKVLESGVDVNATSEHYARTVLHDAAAEGNAAVVDLLIKKGAKVNLRDRYGNTPLYEASRNRNRSKAFRDVVKLLENAGARSELHVPSFVYSAEFSTVLAKAIPVLAARGGWNFVEALLPSEDGKRLQSSSAVWSTAPESSNFAKLRKAAEVLSYDIAEGDFPAVAVTKKGSVLLSDLPVARRNDRISEKCFQVCDSNGAKSGMAVPIYHQDQLLTVLVFLGTQPRSQLDQSYIQDFTRDCTNMLERSLTSAKLAVSKVPGGLQQQIKDVEKMIVSEGVFSENVVFQEVDQYYNRLGFPNTYFTHYPAAIISKHVHALIAAKKVSQITGDVDTLKFDYETPDGWFFLCPMTRKAVHSSETRLEDYVGRMHPPVPRASTDTPSGPRSKTVEGTAPVPYSISFFRSSGTLATSGPHATMHVGLYVVERSTFREPNPAENDTDIGRLGTETFLKERATSPQLRENYQRIVNRASATFAPVIEVLPTEDNVTPMMFAYKTTAVGSSMSNFSELFDNLNIVVDRKHVDSFSNGVVVHTAYVLNANKENLSQIVEQAGLLYHVHNPALLPLLADSVERYAYAHCAINCIYYFVNQRSEEFVMLAQALKDDTVNTARLNMLQNNLRRDAVTQARIIECVLAYPQLVDDLYADFARVQKAPLEPNKALLAAIKKAAQNELDEQILTAMHTFNCSILKTNFWKKDKAAISFRLKTDFLKGLYPEQPFGLFYVMGGSFRGFHMRFRDIARGGIRLVTSAGKQVYRRNLDRLFDENYSLASTQQRKNKDLPEGGSKGVILLGTEWSDPTFSFQQYVDSVLDLLLPHPEVVNHYRTVYASTKEDEILFFGPDEGTAPLMDWACLHAKHRGYKFWKSFTTGKSPTLGGIPHDEYGMTTRSIHKYVTETLNKLGVREEDCTKTQMGGPDGDLGSNEILISKDKTTSVVDKSGVIYDPNGLDRAELTRLVKMRSPVHNFDPKKLSAKGFKVLQSDKDVKLPDGTVVESGLAFRNEFHLTPYSTADLFVPCGGRPEAVNVRNVHRLFHKDGQTPRFKYVIEGANLFLTQDARLALEKSGVVLYKDASANKGGVTSSSLEVLAALALTDEEFAEHMSERPDGSRPEFYKKYVKQVQQRLENNALLEWSCIWKEHERTGIARSVLTDQLSLKINELTDGIKLELWENSPIKRQILESAIPPVLKELIGIDKVMQRVPTNYQQATFGAYIASHYIYHTGMQASELFFYRWMNNYLSSSTRIEV